MKKIFINAGHGGKDSGAIGKSGIKEKIITNKIARILGSKLFEKGYIVELFQEEKGLEDISNQEKNSNSNLFVSIHCNSHANRTANGVETFYYSSSLNGKKAAQCVQNSLINVTKLINRGVKTEGFYVLKTTKAPAILVECAFISNTNEEKLLNEKPELFAEGIFQGIIEYIK
ncbi:MAG: N-acetylmuramoyl-L-alanine amidase [Candidatus Gastranaerophilales bacterium]|nr:N-acetylmuramoyl-L-alanine amidase [Candidatus Gastranaerophilales bacterium]